MDRISKLPDLVLSHILSFLPTKLAVSTCVLSKRWQFLWIMIHNLDLECNHEEEQIVTRFFNFVNRFFTLRGRDLHLKMFHLKYFARIYSSKHVDSWILAAMSSGIEKFVLEIISDAPFFPFRCNVFSCKTLVVLKLTEDVLIVAPPQSSIHFPSLKLLYLQNVEFENQNSFNNLLSGCPVLENLEMYQVFHDFTDFVISSPTLTRFVFYLSGDEKPIRISVDAPSLKYLNLELDTSKDIYLKNLHNLVEATLHFECADADIFRALHNVRVLELALSTVEALRDASFEGFPIFQNLVELKLGGFCCYWRMLLSLLQKLPLLQHLTIDCYDCSYNCSGRLCSETWAELYVSNRLSHLRTLCFHGEPILLDDEDYNYSGQMEFLRNVVKYSKVLENVTVSICDIYEEEEKEALKQKIASFERASKKCQIKFEASKNC